MHIDPHRLIRLGELLKQGSFRKAADRLNITQPALSQSITQLEAELGVRLVDRTPHGIVPTVYGDALLHHAKEIEWQLSEAATKIAELAFGRQDVLAIGGTSGGAISLMALTICRLYRTFPGVETRIMEETWSRALLAQIDDRTLDIAICHQPEDTEMDGKLALPLFRAHRVLCVRADHPQANNLTLTSVAQYPFACPGGEMGISHDIRRIFNALQVEFPTHQIIVSNSLSAAKEIVLNSDAFAIFSDLSVINEDKSGAFKLAKIDEIATEYWYYMVARDDHVVTQLLSDFISALGEVCREQGIELHADVGRIKAGRRLRR